MIPKWRPLVIPEAQLEPPEYEEHELEIVLHCAWCGEGIYEEEDYYEVDGKPVCSECISNCCKVAGRSA